MPRSQPHQLCCPACVRMPLHVCRKHHWTCTTRTQPNCCAAVWPLGHFCICLYSRIKLCLYNKPIKGPRVTATTPHPQSPRSSRIPDCYVLHVTVWSYPGYDATCLLVRPIVFKLRVFLLSWYPAWEANLLYLDFHWKWLHPCLYPLLGIKRALCLQGISQRTHTASMLS